MRILMVAYTYFECDNRVRRYAETLARQGDTVEVVSLRQPGHECLGDLNGIKIFRIQGRVVNEKTKFDYLFRVTAFLFKSFWFITKHHLKNRYDLIHVHSVPDFEIFAALIPKLMGTKVILDIHDIVPEFYASKFNSGNNSCLSTLLKIVEKICCGFADHVIISNHIWGERLIARSIRKEKCTVILNFPDTSMFCRTRAKKESGKFIMMYPGTIAWHQGIDIAVKAMALVAQKNPSVEFHIYGRGPEEHAVEELVASMKLNGCVKIFGLTPLEDVAEKMMDVDLGIVPKRGDNFGGEAFSTKTLEFMAVGVPMLIAKTKIDAYYFDDSKVLFFEPGNEMDLAVKILSIAGDEKLRESLIENGLHHIQENNWDVKKHDYLTIVESLTGNRPKQKEPETKQHFLATEMSDD